MITYSESLFVKNTMNVLVNNKLVGEVTSEEGLFKARKFANIDRSSTPDFVINYLVNQTIKTKYFQSFEVAVAYITELSKANKEMQENDIQISLF